MSQQHPAHDPFRQPDRWTDPSASGAAPTPGAGFQGDPDATLPLTPAYGAWPPPGMPYGPPGTPPGGWPADPAATQPATQPWAGPPPWAAPGTPPPGWPQGMTPPGGVPPVTGGYAAADWGPEAGPQVGTAYGTRPPTPPGGIRRGGTAGSGGSGRTPPAMIIASVIGVAAVLAIAVWLLMLRPEGGGTAVISPTPAPTVLVTPGPTATPEADTTEEPIMPTPEPTRFRNPTFAGLGIRDAESLADRADIIVEVTYEVTDDVAADTVIAQDPLPGTDVLPGDVVRLTVAAPVPAIAMPDLRGFTEDDAISALLDAGLSVGERAEALDAETPAGVIVRTDPRGGLQVMRDTPVDYLVSLGAPPAPSVTPVPTQLPAPGLVGLDRDDAIAIADAAGLLLEIQVQETLDDEPGTVLAQAPEAGSALLPGDTLTIVVAVLPSTVVVPELRGTPEADAISVLIDAGLQPGARSEASHDQIPAGQLIRTDPRAGIAVAPDTVVDYVVSLGVSPTPTPAPTPELVDAPDLLFVSLEEAQARADDARLVLSVAERETLDADPGTVLEQDPAAGTSLIVGDEVRVVVALRPASLAVPVLRGLMEPDAVSALLDSALVPGERSDRFHPSVPAGTVIRTDPSAGTIVALDTVVDYILSLGPEPSPTPEPTQPPAPTAAPTPAPVPVPELRGLRLGDAEALALRSELRLEIVDQETEDAPAETILEQDPRPGAELRRGEVVRVTVARQPANVAVPVVRGLAEADAVSVLMDADLTPGERLERFHGSITAGAVIRTDPAAGEVVPRGSSVGYTVSIGPEPTPVPTQEPTPPPIVVPNLVGGPLGDAQRFADDTGLVLDIRTRETADAPPDAVLEQDPAAGGELRPGDTVQVLVAIPPTSTTVPDVREQAEADAVAMLFDAGLVAGTRTQRFHASVPEGAVIRTVPAGGTVVALETNVDYVVSRGPQPTPSPTAEPTATPIEVPDVVGLDVSGAQAIADDLGLTLGVVRRDTEDAPDGTVLRQEPPAGSPLVSGDELRVLVARGLSTAVVPELRGLSEADGVALLADSGLRPGSRIDRSHDQVAQDAIIRTDPPAGRALAPGTAVDYVVSRGPESTGPPLSVPDLRGQPLADARSTAEAMGLQLDVTRRPTDAAAPNTVLEQDPEPGAGMRAGDTVRVTVADILVLVVVPDLRDLAEADGVAVLVDAGLESGRRLERWNGNVPAGIITRTDPPAGSEVAAGSPVDYFVSRGPEPALAPDLVGLSIRDVRAIADASGITLDVRDVDDTSQPPGTVLDQDPDAGQPLAGPIVVLVARRDGLVAVPDLRNLAEADGVAALLEAGLEAGRRLERWNANVEAGIVTRTDPSAGSAVAAGSAVDYVVSRGPEPLLVPDLRGLSLPAARDIADQAGLDLEVGTEVTRDAEPDTIVSQDPDPGSASDGRPVRVIVAEAPSTAQVPRLRGLTEADAIGAILDAGLEPGTRRERFHGTIEAGLVTGSQPRGAAEVEPGSAVDYILSRGPDPDAGATPEPEPTDEPEPEPAPTDDPTDDPVVAGQLDPDTSAQVDDIVGQVPGIRQLDQLAGIPYRSLTRREFRRELRALYDAANPASVVTAEETTLKRLGLLPARASLRTLTLSLLESQVPAFYDPTSGTLAVVQRPGSFDAARRFATAHQVAHALQDQHFDLDTLAVADRSQTDRALARQALGEGDAAAVMIDWAGTHLSGGEQSQLGSLSPADPALVASLPPLLRRQHELWTSDALAFVDALRSNGGWGAVDAAWSNPPGSTEQILHPKRYPSDRPVRVRLPDIASAVGDGWVVSDERTLGEMVIGVLLDAGQDGSPNAWAADGWGGDRLVRLEGPDGAFAVVWQTAWDSDGDADEFSGVADSVLADLPGTHAVLRGVDLTGEAPSPALVIVASDRAVLDTLLTGLGLAG